MLNFSLIYARCLTKNRVGSEKAYCRGKSLVLAVSIDYDQVALIMSCFQERKRVQAYMLLYQGYPPKQVAEELQITRPSLQYYIDDFKENGLIRSEGNDYLFTEKGKKIVKVLKTVDGLDK